MNIADEQAWWTCLINKVDACAISFCLYELKFIYDHKLLCHNLQSNLWVDSSQKNENAEPQGKLCPSGAARWGFPLITRGGTFQVWNLKKLKECSNFGILEGTYGMYFELTVSGRNL